MAVGFVQYLPEGDPLMGRGFKGKTALDEHGQVHRMDSTINNNDDNASTATAEPNILPTRSQHMATAPQASSYREVLAEPKTLVLCSTGFFFQ